ncbi:MAG TPA: hypothetical protein VHZ51_30270, partial [Ktedonobacteraceae bacterium]|nr:hypothetical protein [Ktedonobacteraceae bacterium]
MSMDGLLDHPYSSMRAFHACKNLGGMMSDFVESARHFVNSAVSRTGWEAQKQLRLRNKQGEIDKLLEQR